MHACLEQLPACQRPPEDLPMCAILERCLEAVQGCARDAPGNALHHKESGYVSGCWAGVNFVALGLDGNALWAQAATAQATTQAHMKT